ncbi:MAG: hypothetical protein EOP05_17845 [Proteobacteria bacterium]|nr:MAG: hypothetical protein EOP05_17845 [Pseudomonadota bacterium]
MVTSIFALLYGGPLAAKMKLAKNLSLEAPENIWQMTSVAPILRSRLEADFPAAQIRFESAAHALSMTDWAEAIFKNTKSALDEVTFRRLIEKFRGELQPEFIALDTFRLFPGFLRREKILGPESAAVASRAALELARVTALFSPQSTNSGEGPHLIANPTLEIIETFEGPQSSLVAIARQPETDKLPESDKVVERALNWQEASLFDELRENPKVHEGALLQELNSKPNSLPKTESFEFVISRLESEGFLLRRGT